MLSATIASVVLLASAAYAGAPAQAGQTCGGIAGITCDSGLTCHMTSHVADATGVCEKENTGAQIGQTCGGFAGLKCAAGLTCNITSNVADATGVCEKENSGAQIGQTCGGFAGLKCAAGLTCNITSNVADATGVCEKENSGAQIGQTCGGFAGLPCASGLACIITSSVADATGVCQKKVNAAELGETCGGIAGITCDSGLECIITSSAADATGVCRFAGAALNQFCGGFLGIDCASGLECVITSPPNQSDADGLCKKVAVLGGACGGNVADAAVCPQGLTCVRRDHEGFMPVDQLPQKDIGGICLRLAKAGDFCGGNTKNAPVCEVGTLCRPRRHQKLPTVHVLIIGGGACGALFGGSLQELPGPTVRVSMVCRSNYQEVLDSGFHINHQGRKPYVFRPHAVYRDPAEARSSHGSDFDHVFVMTKATVDPVPLLRPCVGPNTRSISLWQNGIGIEDRVATAFPNTPLISVVMYVGVTQVGPGKIEAAAIQRAVMGLHLPAGTTRPKDDVSQEIARLLTSRGVTALSVADVRVARWHKTLWNATFGFLGLCAGGVDSLVLTRTPDARACVRELMEEVMRISEAVLGAPLPLGTQGMPTLDEFIAITENLGPYKASIIVDWEQGNQTESEFIFGNVIREARRVGVAAPRLETLYVVLRLMMGKRKKEATTEEEGRKWILSPI
ncbi:hypothetical protein HK101_002125 [Irineochytrium annulatum]|nr:hypothetical protein HK101_002125 [Irineochytrium annulatum]